ncbi:hypothetical protein [Burkholderia gladioli]|uniref:hypothetical protein n=1 Tax=Burkholderia gladioli TaxID=28095 RepID=UPI001C5DAC83|nr:hypothetical protein [Burkholderia gladioli]MBW5285982.1 hypothetical protein [Burkholderia gladioli]
MSDKLSDVRHDYVHCIGRTHRDFYGQSWCGRNIRSEFHFLDLDHAVENNRQGGRLVPCAACVAAATAYFASPAPAISESEDARDAARYRWLRDENRETPEGMRELMAVQYRLPFSEGTDTELFDVALDSAIDAARKGEKS